MQLDNEEFKKIVNGKKTIEVRLFDVKRYELCKRDLIEFTDNETSEVVWVEVVDLIRCSKFSDLFSMRSLQEFGASITDSLEDLVERVHDIYSREDEAKYGALGIVIRLL